MFTTLLAEGGSESRTPLQGYELLGGRRIFAAGDGFGWQVPLLSADCLRAGSEDLPLLSCLPVTLTVRLRAQACASVDRFGGRQQSNTHADLQTPATGFIVVRVEVLPRQQRERLVLVRDYSSVVATTNQSAKCVNRTNYLHEFHQARPQHLINSLINKHAQPARLPSSRRHPCRRPHSHHLRPCRPHLCPCRRHPQPHQTAHCAQRRSACSIGCFVGQGEVEGSK